MKRDIKNWPKLVTEFQQSTLFRGWKSQPPSKNQHCYQNRRIISQLVRDYEKLTGDSRYEIHVLLLCLAKNEPLSEKKSSFMSRASKLVKRKWGSDK